MLPDVQPIAAAGLHYLIRLTEQCACLTDCGLPWPQLPHVLDTELSARRGCCATGTQHRRQQRSRYYSHFIPVIASAP